MNQTSTPQLPHALPIGYRRFWTNNQDVVEIHEQEAAFVREAFAMFATGKYKYEDIAKALSAKGMLGKQGKPIGITGIWKLLRDTRYLGSHPLIPAIVNEQGVGNE